MTSQAPRRVVLYGRTSADDADHEGRSVDGQLTELRAWAEREGRRVVAVLRDDGRSASRFARSRPRQDWPRVMGLVTTGQVDELAVWEISRSTRDRAVWAALLAACITHRVNLVVGGKVHDPSDPDDGFVLDLGAALAVREASVISKRTLRGKRNGRGTGRPPGTVNYGYARRFDPETGKVIGREAHPEQAPVVIEVVRRLLAGETARAITADLNRRGVPTKTGKPWQSGNLVKMALRPVYAGLVAHGTDERGRAKVVEGVTGTWPALISVEDHRRLRALFDDPARDKYRADTRSKHLGTGLFRCGRPGCAGTMRVVRQKRSAGVIPEYSCRTCFRVSRRMDAVDQLVESLVCGYLSSPSIAAELAALDDDPAARAAADEVTRIEARITEYQDYADTHDVSAADFDRRISRLRAQKAEAEERARPRHLPAVVWSVAGPEAEQRWAALDDVAAKRVIIGALFVVTIKPAGRGKWRFDPDLVTVEWCDS